MKVDAALLEIFRDETAERLDRVVETLLAVEAGQASAEAVDALFRDVHSIKGNAGMVGFEEARALAHAMEDLLEPARERGALDAELADPLLRATDAIRRVVAGEPEVAEAALRELATAHRDPEGPAESASAAKPSAQPEGGPVASSSIRVAAEKVDRLLDSVGEAVLQHRRVDYVLGANGGQAGEAAAEELDRGARLLDELQHAAIEMRTLPLSSIAGAFPRAVRDLARQEGKEARLEMSGVDTQLDRTILDGISETITHLLTNAVVHGLEAPEERERAGKPREGRIHLAAHQRGGLVAIEVNDDGAGVSAEVAREAARAGSLVDVLARAGFSTAAAVTQSAGRGVGLDAVKARVESLGGTLELDSAPGAGMRVTLLLPLTLALLRVLLVERGGRPFGLPLAAVAEARAVEGRMWLAGRASIEVRGASVPLADLAELTGMPAPALGEEPPALVVSAGGARLAAACDRVLGEQELVVKSLGPVLAATPGLLGAAILGDGQVALILDPAWLVRRPGAAAAGNGRAPAPAEAGRTILVVDDQFTVREIQRSILEAAGYRVKTAQDGREALEAISGDGAIDLVVTDVQMPRMDGFQLLEAIRADPDHGSLPVVVVTSQAGEDDRRRGAEAGADAYMVKQEFNQGALLETVGRLVGG